MLTFNKGISLLMISFFNTGNKIIQYLNRSIHYIQGHYKPF